MAGRLSPFIELGVGFNADLTARDNVLINAVMLGLSRKQARARFDEHRRVRRAGATSSTSSSRTTRRG